MSQQKEQKNDLTQHSASQTETQAAYQSSDQSQTTTDVDEVTEETTWSAPDSTGTQYPIKTTKTTRKTHSETKNDMQTSQDSETQTSTQEDVDDNSETKTKTNLRSEDDSKTKTKTPAWIIVLIVGVLAIVAIVVLLILKRYKII